MRWLFFLIILMVVSAVLFEYLFRENLKVLQLEARSVPQTRYALNATIKTYPDNATGSPLWVFKGNKVNFGRNITFKNFYGKNLSQNFTVRSDEAIFLQGGKKIELKGNVVIKFHRNGQPYTFYTSAASVDTEKGVIYGNHPVKLEGGGKTLTGNSFYYDYRNGISEVRGNVTTTISE
jgi:LPS export ABC transporter protein LptC